MGTGKEMAKTKQGESGTSSPWDVRRMRNSWIMKWTDDDMYIWTK